MPFKVSKAQFATLVEKALEELPEQFANHLEEISLEILDRPTEQLLPKARVQPGNLLLGLYVGRAITQRSVEDSGVMPDVIYIFQEPIQAVCRDEVGLVRQVRITVLHEIGHHFGLNEDERKLLEEQDILTVEKASMVETPKPNGGYRYSLERVYAHGPKGFQGYQAQSSGWRKRWLGF